MKVSEIEPGNVFQVWDGLGQRPGCFMLKITPLQDLGGDWNAINLSNYKMVRLTDSHKIHRVVGPLSSIVDASITRTWW